MISINKKSKQKQKQKQTSLNACSLKTLGPLSLLHFILHIENLRRTQRTAFLQPLGNG